MSSVCRVCLDSNKQLLSVKNNMLHKIYEKITNTKFNSEDARPRALCCFCYQKLLRCHTFSQMAVRSEKIFSYFYDKGLEITHEYITEVNLNVKQHLSVANTSFVTIDDNATKAGSQVTIKDEPLPSIDMNEEFTTAQDTLLETESFPEVCTQSQITFEEDISDQENDTHDLLSENFNNDQSKPDASSFTIKDEPLSCIDNKEEITTELDKLVEIEFFPEDTEELLYKHVIIKKTQHLHNNMIAHTGEKLFACYVCDKQFNCNSHLVCHMRTHTGEKPFACNVCEKRFSQRSNLVNHMKTHAGEKPFACNVCDKQFKRKDHLALHIRMHTGEKPFACNVCEKRFYFKSHLNKHMMTHTGEKPFACSKCKKQFNQKSNLVCHMQTHAGEKRFSCHVCEKTFYVKSYLNTHVKMHTGEKPFACSVCKKQCSTKSNLVCHMKIHAGEKPFSCHVCEKRFYVKSHLNQHMITHTGVKPFSCNACDKQFKRKYSLVLHMRTHAPQKHPKPATPRG